jgi:GT2 family glycosyltransferase
MSTLSTLDWSLVVATLNREECLVRSLRANVQQSRPPKQVIVVDASTGWKDVRDRVLREVAPLAPSVEWIYVGSAQRSSTYQRNRGLERCQSGIVFFLDDDSFMYRNCAETIMRVYEADQGESIGGVSAALAPTHESDDAKPEPTATDSQPRWSRALHALWDQEKLFLPYDGTYHVRELSAEQQQRGLHPLALFHGCRMTFRTNLVRAIGGFEETLRRTAFGEDCDLSYRVSRKHALVLSPSALLFHEQTPVARPKRMLNTTLILLNAVVLYRLHAPKERQSKRHVLGFLAKRLALEALRDGMRARFRAPCVRGALRALQYAPALLALDLETLGPEYAKLQDQLCQSG